MELVILYKLKAVFNAEMDDTMFLFGSHYDGCHRHEDAVLSRLLTSLMLMKWKW